LAEHFHPAHLVRGTLLPDPRQQPLCLRRAARAGAEPLGSLGLLGKRLAQRIQRADQCLERIRKTMTGLTALPAQDACNQLFESLMKYQKGSKQDDDVTLVAVHTR